MPSSPTLAQHPFLIGGGQTGALIAGHDWAGTPLGPVEGWPQSLRTTVGILLHSPVPIVLLWGPEGVMIYNDAYSVFAGGRHPTLLGSKVREGWPEVADFNDNVMRVGLAGGTLAYRDQELTLFRSGRPEQVFMNLDYSPVPDEDGRPAGVIAIVVETTARVMAERRQAFRLHLEERLRETSDPRAILDAAVEALGRHLGASRVGYSSVEPGGETIMLEACYANGVAPLRGRFRLDDFGPASVARQRLALTEVCEDVLDDPAQVHATWAAIETRAFASVPLVRDGELRASLYVNFREPHAWTPEEVALIEEVAARTWSAVERRAAEAAVRETAARLELALEAGRLAEVTFDVVNGGVAHSPTFAELFGHPPERRLTLDEIRAQYHPEDCDRVLGERHAILTSGQAFYEVEKRIVRPDGSVRWVYGRGRVSRDAGGEARSVTAVYLDDTARKLAEQTLRELNETLEQQVAERTAELRANQARMRAAFETSYTFQGLMAPDGTLLDTNGTALASIRCRLEDVVGRPVWDTPWFDRTPGMPEAVRQAVGRVAAGETFRQEIHVNLPTGWRWFDFSMRPILDEARRVVAIVPEAVETTERRHAEEALRQSQKLEAIGQLTGGIAHDFNNLLQAVQGSLDLIRRSPGDAARVQRIAEAGLEAATRGAKLTGQLLAFSRSQRIEPRPLVLASLLAGLEDLLARTIGPLVRLRLEVDSADLAVLADPTQVEMAVLNLAINARDAMPDGGTLTLAIAAERIDGDHELAPGEYAVLAVRDTGLGMEPEVAARALEPFFTTKGVGKGTGLGLSQVYGMARQTGGTVRIGTRPGAGTTVRLYLPRAELPARADADDPAGRADGGAARATLLVVDDDADVRRWLADALDALGHRVVQAADGQAALRTLERVRPDAMLVDYAMPEMTGAELVRIAQGRWPDLPVLFASGYSQTSAIRAVAPDALVLRKPFQIAELEAALAAVMGKPGTSGAEAT